MNRNRTLAMVTGVLALAVLTSAEVRTQEETPQARHERDLKRMKEILHGSYEKGFRDELVVIDGCENDADLLLLGESQDLTHLELVPNYDTFTNKGFAFLEKTKDLTFLTIGSTIAWSYPNVDEGLLKYAEGLPKLKTIELITLPITDRGLASLGKISTLQSIQFYSDGITGEGLRHLEALPNLYALTIWSSEIFAKESYTLEAVSKLSELEVLNLQGVNIKVKDLAYLKALKHLHTLDLHESKIDGGFEALLELPHLRKLGLSSVTDADMVVVGKLPLTRLYLGGCAISDEGLSHLKGSLKELSIAGTQISDAGLTQLVKNQTALEKLILNRCSIADAAMISVAQFKKLEHLELLDCPITDNGLLQLQKLTNLKYLIITRLKIPEGTIHQLKAALPNLEVRVFNPSVIPPKIK